MKDLLIQTIEEKMETLEEIYEYSEFARKVILEKLQDIDINLSIEMQPAN